MFLFILYAVTQTCREIIYKEYVRLLFYGLCVNDFFYFFNHLKIMFLSILIKCNV